MDYNYIESLILSTKEGDTISKEQLFIEFKPFILNLSKRTSISTYEFIDIQNECYLALLIAIEKYNPEKHRFVAYATNTIKNTIYQLIKKSNSKSSINPDLLTFIENLDLATQPDIIQNKNFTTSSTTHFILNLIKNLSYEEQELLTYIFLRHNTLKSYAAWKNMNYSTASKKKILLSKKIDKYIFDYLN